MIVPLPLAMLRSTLANLIAMSRLDMTTVFPANTSSDVAVSNQVLPSIDPIRVTLPWIAPVLLATTVTEVLPCTMSTGSPVVLPVTSFNDDCAVDPAKSCNEISQAIGPPTFSDRAPAVLRTQELVPPVNLKDIAGALVDSGKHHPRDGVSSDTG